VSSEVFDAEKQGLRDDGRFFRKAPLATETGR
jgi:hypothetical protein